MDAKEKPKTSIIKKILKILGILVAVSALGGGGWFGFNYWKAHKSSEHAKNSEHEKHSEHGKSSEHAVASEDIDDRTDSNRYLSSFKDAAENVHLAVETFKNADEENRKLKIENINLRRWVEDLKYNCISQEGQSQSNELSRKLASETGTKMGRVLASIQYRPPAHLSNPQLHTLAVSYFKAKEFEKAAVILSFLTSLDETQEYKTAEKLLMTGVTWYRLDHFKLADGYFDRVLELPASKDDLQYQAQARLWKAIIHERMGDHSHSQEWLQKLLEEHPHSVESSWINRGDVVSQAAPALVGQQQTKILYNNSQKPEERAPASEDVEAGEPKKEGAGPSEEADPEHHSEPHSEPAVEQTEQSEHKEAAASEHSEENHSKQEHGNEHE